MFFPPYLRLALGWWPLRKRMAWVVKLGFKKKEIRTYYKTSVHSGTKDIEGESDGDTDFDGAVQCSAIQCRAVQYSAIYCNLVQ